MWCEPKPVIITKSQIQSICTFSSLDLMQVYKLVKVRQTTRPGKYGQNNFLTMFFCYQCKYMLFYVQYNIQYVREIRYEIHTLSFIGTV